MRWISILVCSAALAANSASAQAQAAPAKATAPQGVTHLMLPPVPKALLPESFAGWVPTNPPKTITDPAKADPANAAALKEYDFTDGALAGLQAQRRDAQPARAALSRRQRSLWRLFLLPPEWLAEGRDRHGRHVEPQPCALLAGQHGGGCELFAHRPHVGRGAARAGRPVARPRGKQGAGASHPGQSAAGLRWTGRPRTMRWGRRAMPERAECCRRSWSASIAARRP